MSCTTKFAKHLPPSSLMLALTWPVTATLAVPAPEPKACLVTSHHTMTWLPPPINAENTLGTILLPEIASPKGDQGQKIQVTPASGSLGTQRVTCQKDPTGHNIAIVYLKNGDLQLTVSLSIAKSDRETIEVDIRTDTTGIAKVTLQPTSLDLAPKNVQIPYYSGSIGYVATRRLFINSFLDAWHSAATRIQENSAIYEQDTSGRRNPTRERVTIRASRQIERTFPEIPNPPSPFKSKLAGRIVLDIWDSPFSEIAQVLDQLKDYGLTNCVVLINNWQRSGYDNALPAHVPADPTLGGDTALKSAIASAKTAGCLTALHENYVDYYPNYDHFNHEDIAVGSDGHDLLGWLNPKTQIQSYATKPSRYAAIAGQESSKIRRLYSTDATYIDVLSAVRPWWHVDMDGRLPEAGKFSASMVAAKNLWSLERQIFGGPVLGEGGQQNWYWAGLLDGVEAEFGAGETTTLPYEEPLFVDFDLLQIHPLAVNHGVGLYDRWLDWHKQHQDIRNTNLIDTYRMQEVAFGHAPFISSGLWTSIPRVMTEQNLVGPLSLLYGEAHVKSIAYEVRGRWVDTEEATLAGDWSRPRIQYENGLTIIANSSTAPLHWANTTIPENGWWASGPGILAFTAVRDQQIADYCDTPDAIFANARNQRDLVSAESIAEVEATNFRQRGPRSADIELTWTPTSLIQQTLPNLKILAHFLLRSAAKPKPTFQADTWPSAPTSAWKPTETIPTDHLDIRVPIGAPDGTYSVLVGLFSETDGHRYPLLGTDDSEKRYSVGDLTVSQKGASLSFLPLKATLPNDPRLNQDGRIINFATLKTDGMISLRHTGETWNTYVFPTTRNVQVFLSSNRFTPPTDYTCGSQTKIKPKTDQDGFWQLKTGGANRCTWASDNPPQLQTKPNPTTARK